MCTEGVKKESQFCIYCVELWYTFWHNPVIQIDKIIHKFTDCSL